MFPYVERNEGTMEPITTAALAVALLAAQKGAEKMGDEAGRATWSGLGKLAAAVRTRLSGNAEGEKALSRVERQPNDQQAMSILGVVLQRQMERDALFAHQLEQLVREAETDGKVTHTVSIQAETIKAVFQEQVHVQGNFEIK